MRVLRLVALITLFCISALFAGTQAISPPEQSSSLVLDTNWGDNTVSLVNIATGKELSVINVGTKPYDVQLEPRGRFAYVSNSGSGDISVIDVQAMLESHRIQVGDGPRDIDISSDGKFAVSANSGDDTISVIDLDARREVKKIRVGSIPYGIALMENDKVAVVSNWGENTISIVDLDGAKERQPRLRSGSLPYTVAPLGDGGHAIVTNFGSHTVTAIDVRGNRVLGQTAVGRSPWGIGLTPDGRGAIVADFYAGEVSFLQVTTAGNALDRGDGDDQGSTAASSAFVLVETARMRLSSEATATTPTPGSNAVALNTVSSVVAPAAILGGPVRTARRAKNAAISADGKTAVVSDLGNNELLVIDMESKQILRSVKVGRAPYGIAFLRGRSQAARQ